MFYGNVSLTKYTTFLILVSWQTTLAALRCVNAFRHVTGLDSESQQQKMYTLYAPNR